MIQETKTDRCRVCDSENIVKNGTNCYGNQQYWCKDGARQMLKPKPPNVHSLAGQSHHRQRYSYSNFWHAYE